MRFASRRWFGSASPLVTLAVFSALAAAFVACGNNQQGTTAAIGVTKVGIPPAPGTSKAPPAASTSEPGEGKGADKAARWGWSAIGCFIGGPWSEAMGALGDERNLATVKRCRTVVSALGEKVVAAGAAHVEDEKTLEAVRTVDPATVDRLIAAMKKEGANDAQLALVLAAADAAREAMLARRAAEGLRTAASAKSDKAAVLGARVSLSKLWKLGTDEAQVVALVIAADHLEAVRGLEPRDKITTAAPAFQVVFGVPDVASAEGAKAADWVSYLTTAATAAGHAPTVSAGSSSHDREQLAFRGVAAGLADKFEALAAKLEAGEAKDAAGGYAHRLRVELSDAEQKAKSKTPPK